MGLAQITIFNDMMLRVIQDMGHLALALNSLGHQINIYLISTNGDWPQNTINIPLPSIPSFILTAEPFF